MKQKIQLLLILLLLTSGALQAQMKTITGEVFDENKEPLLIKSMKSLQI